VAGGLQALNRGGSDARGAPQFRYGDRAKEFLPRALAACLGLGLFLPSRGLQFVAEFAFPAKRLVEPRANVVLPKSRVRTAEHDVEDEDADDGREDEQDANQNEPGHDATRELRQKVHARESGGGSQAWDGALMFSREGSYATQARLSRALGSHSSP